MDAGYPAFLVRIARRFALYDAATGNVVLENGSPAWLKLTGDTAAAFDTLVFDYEFTTEGDSNGMLSVYFDGSLVAAVEQRYAGQGVNAIRPIALGNVPQGTHTLGFRLDMLTDVRSRVEITNVRVATGEIERTSNIAPVAAIETIDATVPAGQPVTLDGRSSSDTDNLPSPLSFYWTQVSGPASLIEAPWSNLTSVTPTQSGAYSFQLIVRDGQSNSEPATVSFTAEVVDVTPPVVVPNVAGTLGAGGWYTGDVTVSWSVTDAESTVTISTGCETTSVTSDTTGTTLTCEATSTGGTTLESVTIKRDATRPTAAATRTPAANANGWNNSAVTVTFEGADSISGSGIANCTAPTVLSTDGANQTATGSCTDIAGNSSAPASATASIDRTGPTATVSTPANGSSYQQGASVTAAYSCTDATSGITSCVGSTPAGSAISTGTAGTQTFTVTVTDRAGNVTTSTVTYTVSKKSKGGGGALNLWSVIGLAALAATRRRRPRARQRSIGDQRRSRAN